jgi:antirestriction protein ArdC
MRRRLSGAPAVPFLKSYIVFNVEQIAGLPEHYYAKPGAKRPELQRIEHAEQFFAATKADAAHGPSIAGGGFHQEVLHHFWNAEAYYATLAQNLVTANSFVPEKA